MDLKIDVLRTRQILINLIQNAIKFSMNHQEVVVVVKTQPIPNSNKVTLEIKVIDHGIGICDQDKANLFKPYFRSSVSNQMKY
jgi:signal transduction histidine kinase